VFLADGTLRPVEAIRSFGIELFFWTRKTMVLSRQWSDGELIIDLGERKNEKSPRVLRTHGVSLKTLFGHAQVVDQSNEQRLF
jgi:hypothetical protein